MRIAGLYPHVARCAPNGEVEGLEPLGLQSVLGQAASRGHQVELFTLLNQTEDELLKNVQKWSPDVLAVSTMTPQMPEALKLTAGIKKILPDIKVVFGGYHASVVHLATPRLVTDSLVDIWIRGEGEQTFLDVLEAFESSDNMADIAGVTLMRDGKIITSPPRPRVCNLDELAPAWRPNFVTDLRSRGMNFPAPSEQTGFASIEHSRGCLGDCKFCASPGVIGRSVSFRSPDRVIEEIRYLSEEMGVNTFFFTDLDFIQRGKSNQDKVEKLLDKLSQLDTPVWWECMGRIRSISDTGNYALLEKMYRAGCRKIGWGIESIDPEILVSIGKGRHLDDETYQVLATSENAGIFNTAFYIIGWHDFETGIGDNRERILNQADSLPHYPIHRVRVTIGTPLPGSKFYRDCQEMGLLTTDQMEEFDTNHLVYAHPEFSDSELQELRLIIYRSFYGDEHYVRRMENMIIRHPEYRNAVTEFLNSEEMHKVC